MSWFFDRCGCGEWSASYRQALLLFWCPSSSVKYLANVLSVHNTLNFPKTQKFSTAVEFISATTLTAGVARPYYIRPLELKVSSSPLIGPNIPTMSPPKKLVKLWRPAQMLFYFHNSVQLDSNG